MVEAAKKRRPKVQAAPEPETATTPETAEGPAAHAQACPVAWCPICLAVTTVQPLKPDVVEHLLKAGTEFFLAMRSVIDARADDLAGEGRDANRDPGFEKIDIG